MTFPPRVFRAPAYVVSMAGTTNPSSDSSLYHQDLEPVRRVLGLVGHGGDSLDHVAELELPGQLELRVEDLLEQLPLHLVDVLLRLLDLAGHLQDLVEPLSEEALDLAKGVSESSLVLADYRRYVRLGRRSAYAFRAQGLYSDGPNPRTFFLGGSLNLRGYPRRGLQGNRSVLINQEIRFPLVQRWLVHLPVGALEFPSIQGALFIDAGQAWDEGEPPPFVGSLGGSLRMGLGGVLVLRLDLARRTDFEKIGKKSHWDFFIGWNY